MGIPRGGVMPVGWVPGSEFKSENENLSGRFDLWRWTLGGGSHGSHSKGFTSSECINASLASSHNSFVIYILSLLGLESPYNPVHFPCESATKTHIYCSLSLLFSLH